MGRSEIVFVVICTLAVVFLIGLVGFSLGAMVSS